MSSMVAEPSAFLLTIDESSCCPTFSSAFDDIIVLDLTKIMASVSITSWEIDGETVETVSDFILRGSKITADGYCSHEIKICLLLGSKVIMNLDSTLKSRDITLSTKVYIVKAMVFTVDMYGCESWAIKKAECRRTDAFELWCCSPLDCKEIQPVHPKGNQS